jgi:hypothetical protein
MQTDKVNIALKAIRRAIEYITAENPPANPVNLAKLYTWAEIIPYPQDSDFKLRPGLMNLQHIEAQTQLNSQSHGPEIKNKMAGPVLFPFYLRPTDPKKPAELCRILRPFERTELPQL